MILPAEGNFKEGKGTTGFCTMVDGEIEQLGAIKALDYASDVEYWMAHVNLIRQINPDAMVMEGFRLYGHKKNEQVNSELETPQLIGVLKTTCWGLGIPLKIQFAVEVKNRWSDEVLLRKGILKEVGGRTYCNGLVTMRHSRDAIRHAINYHRYKKE